jgi:hypothetical protein
MVCNCIVYLVLASVLATEGICQQVGGTASVTLQSTTAAASGETNSSSAGLGEQQGERLPTGELMVSTDSLPTLSTEVPTEDEEDIDPYIEPTLSTEVSTEDEEQTDPYIEPTLSTEVPTEDEEETDPYIEPTLSTGVPTEDEEEETDPYIERLDEIRRALWLYCSPVLVICGTVGNVLCIIVLRSSVFQSTPVSFTLSLLAGWTSPTCGSAYSHPGSST